MNLHDDDHLRKSLEEQIRETLRGMPVDERDERRQRLIDLSEQDLDDISLRRVSGEAVPPYDYLNAPIMLALRGEIQQFHGLPQEPLLPNEPMLLHNRSFVG